MRSYHNVPSTVSTHYSLDLPFQVGDEFIWTIIQEKIGGKPRLGIQDRTKDEYVLEGLQFNLTINHLLNGINLQEIRLDPNYFVDLVLQAQNGTLVTDYDPGSVNRFLVPLDRETEDEILTPFEFDMKYYENNTEHYVLFGGKNYYTNYTYYIYKTNGIDIFERKIETYDESDEERGSHSLQVEMSSGLLLYKYFASQHDKPEEQLADRTSEYRIVDYDETTHVYMGEHLRTLQDYSSQNSDDEITSIMISNMIFGFISITFLNIKYQSQRSKRQ
ncbi:MAG: hypothetical protein IH840_02130 [Candidatus Heimdallarchaeota archaeon]|nr:hypothetical protein [Candidatus Heimdallarchaeota archaeon]